MKKVRITLVCQVYYPDMQSTSQLLTDLLGSLDKNRFEPTVICGYPALVEDNAQLDAAPAKETHEGVNILRCGLNLNFKKSLFHRALHYFAFLLGASIKVISQRRSDVICGVTNPPFTPVWLWLLAKVFRFKYELFLQDIYPDGLVAVGNLKPTSQINRIWSYLNRKAFARASKIIVLGRDMGDLLEEQYAVPSEKIVYIPHWSVNEPEKRVAAEQTQLWQRLGLNGQFIVQYSGNMGLWHNMEDFVRVADKLRERNDILFLFIGDGRRKGAAEELAQQLKLDNIRWLPFQPKETLHDSLSCVHVALVSQRAGLEGIAVPCKLYGILSVGRALLACVPPTSEIAQVVTEEACGIAYNPGDVAGLAAGIANLADNRDHAEDMGQKAYQAYTSKYQLKHAVTKYSEHWQKDAKAG